MSRLVGLIAGTLLMGVLVVVPQTASAKTTTSRPSRPSVSTVKHTSAHHYGGRHGMWRRGHGRSISGNHRISGNQYARHFHHGSKSQGISGKNFRRPSGKSAMSNQFAHRHHGHRGHHGARSTGKSLNGGGTAPSQSTTPPAAKVS